MKDFLLRFGMSGREGITYVVVPEAGSPEIIAYYMVSPDPLMVVEIEPDEEVEVNWVWLRAMAVASRYQRQGIGTRILGRLIRQTLDAANRHPSIEALALRALDEEAKKWYLERDLGFRESYPPKSLTLDLPVATMRQLLRPISEI